MAQDQSDQALPQIPLTSFISDSLTRLADTKTPIDPIAVFVAAKSYSALRDIFVEHQDELRRAFEEGDESFKKQLWQILDQSRVHIEKETPQLRSQEADIKAPIEVIAEQSIRLHKAREQVNLHAGPQRARLKKQRREFVQRLTDHFSGLDIAPLERLQAGLKEAVDTSPRTKSQKEQARVLGERVFTVLQEDTAVQSALQKDPQLLNRMAQEVREDQQALADTYWKSQRIEETVVNTILREPNLHRPDIFAARALQQLAEAPAHQLENDTYVKTATSKALTVTHAIEVYSAKLPIDPSTNKPMSIGTPLVFFQANETGIKKGLGQLADIALSLPFVPQSFRESVVQGAIARSWEKIIGNPALLTERLGGAFVSSPAYQQAIAQGNAMFGQEKRGGLGSVFGNLLYEGVGLIRGPNEVGLLFLEQQRMASQQTTLVTVVGQFSWQHAYVASSYAHGGAYHLDFLGGLGQWALSYGARKGIGMGVKGVSGFAISKGLGTTIGTTIGTIFGGGPIGGAIGAFIGKVVVDKGLGLLGKIGGGLFSLLSGGFLAGLISGNTKYKDPVALPLAFGLGAMAILFGLGGAGFLNSISPTNLSNASLTSALAKGARGGAIDEEVGSRYIKLTKTASPESIPGNSPTTVTYTIKIEATEETLTGLRATDVFSVFGGSGATSIASPSITLPPIIEPGAPFTTTVSVSLGTQHKDSVVTNTLTVVALVNGKQETKIVNASVIMGRPPTECFSFTVGANDPQGFASSEWDAGGQANILAAIAQISRSPNYVGQLCKAGTIRLYRIKRNYGGGWAQGGVNIFLFNNGVESYRSALYTLAHESGHILASRTGYYGQFRSEGISQREGRIWTYPNAKSDPEDFAETMADYVAYKVFRSSSWPRALDFPGEYPLHYDFAKKIFGVEY